MKEHWIYWNSTDLINRIKDFGYHCGTFARVSVGYGRFGNTKKEELLKKADNGESSNWKDYKDGKITNEKRYRKTISLV